MISGNKKTPLHWAVVCQAKAPDMLRVVIERALIPPSMKDCTSLDSVVTRQMSIISFKTSRNTPVSAALDALLIFGSTTLNRSLLSLQTHTPPRWNLLYQAHLTGLDHQQAQAVVEGVLCWGGLRVK